MADAVFQVGVDLAEGLGVAVALEDGIVAEAALAARGPDDAAVDVPLKGLHMAVGPGERKRAGEMRGIGRGAFRHFLVHAPHGLGEVLVFAAPARGIDAGRAAQCIDHEAAVVGERGLSRCAGGGERLQLRIAAKAVLGLLGFGEAEVARRDRLDAIFAEQRGDLAHLAGIVAGDDERAGLELAVVGSHDVSGSPSAARRRSGRSPCARGGACEGAVPR